MKEILIKTLEAYQEAVDKAKEYKKIGFFLNYLKNKYLEDGICYYIAHIHYNSIERFKIALKKYHPYTESLYSPSPTSKEVKSIKDCVNFALNPRIELLTKMINEYESIN